MKIIYNQNNYFSLFTTESNHIETLFDSLEHISQLISPSDYLLIPEQHFKFTFKHFNFYCSKPYTLVNQKELIQRNCIEDKKNNQNIGELLFYNIDNILLNKNHTDYILSKIGQVQFDLHCIYSHSYCPLDLSSLIKQRVHILPSSYATIQILNNQFSQTKCYNLLYIGKNTSKLIVIKNGFYDNITSINIGSKDLKDIYHEQHISHIFRDQNKVTPITQKIVSDASYFFAQQIIQRVTTQNVIEKDTVIISDLCKNHFFMESLKDIYSGMIGGYIIPFSNLLESEYSNGLETDILSTIQFIKK